MQDGLLWGTRASGSSGPPLALRLSTFAALRPSCRMSTPNPTRGCPLCPLCPTATQHLPSTFSPPHLLKAPCISLCFMSPLLPGLYGTCASACAFNPHVYRCRSIFTGPGPMHCRPTLLDVGQLANHEAHKAATSTIPPRTSSNLRLVFWSVSSSCSRTRADHMIHGVPPLSLPSLSFLLSCRVNFQPDRDPSKAARSRLWSLCSHKPTCPCPQLDHCLELLSLVVPSCSWQPCRVGSPTPMGSRPR